MKYINCLIAVLAIFFFPIKTFSIQIKIVAKVNNQVITNVDLENRLNLAIAISKIPDDINIRNRLQEQILKLLIDESLKIQEAQNFGILISSTEVDNEINRLESKLAMQPNTLVASFRKKNIPETVIYEQIRSQLLWNKLVSIRIANNITITDKQKEENFQNFIKTSGEVEYKLSEVFVSSANNTNFSAKEQVNSIYAKVNTSNFISIAEQFSDGAFNIDSWTRESMLPERVRKFIKKVNIGEITEPIESSIGFHIYLINDKRKTEKIIENQLLYNLNQIFFKFTKNNDNEIQYYKNLLNELRKSTYGCDQLDNSIKNIKNSSGGKLGILPAKALDKRFAQLITKGLNIGQLSDIIITQEGAHSIMLCEPVIKVTYENIKKNIENRLRINKINNGANLLLNRIRQKALIEITS